MEMENLSSYSSAKRSKHGKRPKYKKKTWFTRLSKGKKVAFISSIVAISLCVVLVAGVLVVGNMFKYNHNNEFVKDPEIDSIVPINEGIINIALFGIDTRTPDDFTGRSDSIMILSIDTVSKKVKVISVMRDSFVPIGDSYGKINSAYSKGGPALAVKTLNKVFGLDIKHYATVNFFGMADIIDAVGGLTIDVQKNEINGPYRANVLIAEQCNSMGIPKNEHPYIHKEGPQLLNGIQAVAWARIRYAATAEGTTDDFGRTDRQRVVMNKLFEKALSMPTKDYPKLIKALIPYTETSLTYSDILKFAGVFLGDVTFEEMRIAMPEYIIDSDFRPYGESSVYYNYEYVGKMLHAFIYNSVTPEMYMELNGVDKTRWFGNGYTDSGSGSGNSGGGSGGGATSSATSSTVSDTSSVTSSTVSDTESDTSSATSSEATSSSVTSSDTSSEVTSTPETGGDEE